MPRPTRPSRPSRGRKPADPMFLGEPSPALTKIARMNTEKLGAHILTMKTEAQRLEVKIANLSGMAEPDQQKIEQLTAHRSRLIALTEAAQKLLDGKNERRQQYRSGGYRR